MMGVRSFIAVVALVLPAACGSGGSTSTPPVAQTATVAVSPGGGSATLPSISTYSATLTYPANNAPSGASLAVTATTQTGTPLPGSWNFLWINNPLVSYIFVPSATVTFTAPLTLVLDMGSHFPGPDNPPGRILEIDATGFDLTAQTQYFEGAASDPNFSGTTATFALRSVSGAPITFTAGHTYQIVTNYSIAAA